MGKFKVSKENIKKIEVLSSLLSVDINHFMEYIPYYFERYEAVKDEYGAFVVTEDVLLIISEMIVEDLDKPYAEEFVHIYLFKAVERRVANEQTS